ncbi:MAG: DUF3087 domain-containing protein [Paraglaciecola sp.]|uniref:DUF3087 domain-containing protein n=1 Tax=Paraglaciecola sp. TaxID=1920173 RepID=UPI0032983068
MPLIEINKSRYRRHLNLVIIGCITSLAIGSLAISQILIFLFPDESGRHFHWNLLGVVIASLSLIGLLNKFRRHNFMAEVVYVWELKQTLNKINRKMPKLKIASNAGNADAMLAIQYSYAGSRLLWHLDDNTIVLDELTIQQIELDRIAAKFNLTLNAQDYEESLLGQF